MWIIGNSSRRKTISTGCEVIVAKCSFPASEQLSGNRSSAIELSLERWNRLPEMVAMWMRILCRRSNQDMTDTAKIWEIKAQQLLIPSSTSTSQGCGSRDLVLVSRPIKTTFLRSWSWSRPCWSWSWSWSWPPWSWSRSWSRPVWSWSRRVVLSKT